MYVPILDITVKLIVELLIMSSLSPEARAVEFAKIVELAYNSPPANPLEEEFEGMIGGAVTFRVFTPGGDPRSVPEDFANRLRQRTTEALDGLNITQSFASHIGEILEGALSDGMMRMMGPEFVLSQCGIEIRGEYVKPGFFDPNMAPHIEKATIQLNYPNQYVIEELAREHNKKMDIWVDDYTQTHGKNPLED